MKLPNYSNQCECNSALELIIHRLMFSILINYHRLNMCSSTLDVISSVFCPGDSSPPRLFLLNLAPVSHSKQPYSFKVKGAQKSKSEQCFQCACLEIRELCVSISRPFKDITYCNSIGRHGTLSRHASTFHCCPNCEGYI